VDPVVAVVLVVDVEFVDVFVLPVVSVEPLVDAVEVEPSSPVFVDPVVAALELVPVPEVVLVVLELVVLPVEPVVPLLDPPQSPIQTGGNFCPSLSKGAISQHGLETLLLITR
jgi:hypothetical protein